MKVIVKWSIQNLNIYFREKEICINLIGDRKRKITHIVQSFNQKIILFSCFFLFFVFVFVLFLDFVCFIIITYY